MGTVPSQPAISTSGIHSEPDTRVNLRRLFAFTWSDSKKLLMTTVDNFFTHNVPRLGASLAYYTMLSMAPLLIVVLAVAGLLYSREAAEGQLVWQIQDLVGRQGAEAIQAIVRNAQQPATGSIATILGLLTLFWGATAVVAELRNALNTIWCVPVPETAFGLRTVLDIVRHRTFDFGLVLGIGFLLLVSLALNAFIAALGARFQAMLTVPSWLLQIENFIASFLVITVLFAIMFKVLPDLSITWFDVLPGAAFTSLLFTIGKTLIGMYLGRASFVSSYGAAASIVIMLVWVYYSAQIFFLGAEFTQSYAQMFGSRPCNRIGREVKVFTTIDHPSEAVTGEPRILTPKSG